MCCNDIDLLIKLLVDIYKADEAENYEEEECLIIKNVEMFKI